MRSVSEFEIGHWTRNTLYDGYFRHYRGKYHIVRTDLPGGPRPYCETPAPKGRYHKGASLPLETVNRHTGYPWTVGQQVKWFRSEGCKHCAAMEAIYDPDWKDPLPNLFEELAVG